MADLYQIVASKGDDHYLLKTFKYGSPAKNRLNQISSALTYFRGQVQLVQGAKLRSKGKYVKLHSAKEFKAALTKRQLQAVKPLL